MTVLFMLTASVLHASWHALVKSAGDQLTVLTGMSLVASLVALAALPFVALPPVHLWPVIVVSLLLHSGYRFSLAQAYAHGDLSAAYPLARGLVPLFATAIGIWLLGQTLSTAQLAGVVTVSTGVIWLATEALRTIQIRLIAAAAGVGLTVAGYSVLDSYAARASANWYSFTAWLIALDSGTFVLLMFALRRRRLWQALVNDRWRVLISGILGVSSFAVFIWALSRSPVGGVTALRETSILFATLIGMIFYREGHGFQRLAAAAIISIGVGLIAVSR